MLEDGVPQQIQFFAQCDLPLDVVLLLDTSGSMKESLSLVQQAAKRFVRALRQVDRASVMTISNSLRVLQTFTNDATLLDQAIASTRAAGRTPLYASIYGALSEIGRERKATTSPRREALVVLSDGIDTSSTLAFADLIAIVRRNAVPIYPIAPRPAMIDRWLREAALGEPTSEQDFELRTLATETGGLAFFPTALSELTTVYDSIAEELAHQYSLGYQSSNPSTDGAYRRITLKILSPGLKWRTRAGYLADRSRDSAVANPR